MQGSEAVARWLRIEIDKYHEILEAFEVLDCQSSEYRTRHFKEVRKHLIWAIRHQNQKCNGHIQLAGYPYRMDYELPKVEDLHHKRDCMCG